jgi:hypothetical protein
MIDNIVPGLAIDHSFALQTRFFRAGIGALSLTI